MKFYLKTKEQHQQVELPHLFILLQNIIYNYIHADHLSRTMVSVLQWNVVYCGNNSRLGQNINYKILVVRAKTQCVGQA